MSRKLFLLKWLPIAFLLALPFTILVDEVSFRLGLRFLEGYWIRFGYHVMNLQSVVAAVLDLLGVAIVVKRNRDMQFFEVR